MQTVEDIKVNRSVISITTISESDEKDYWLAQTPEKRLEAMEMMPRVSYGYDENSPGLQRVPELTQRK